MSSEREARRLAKQGDPLAGAELLERSGQLAAAAELFLEANRPQRAGACFERAGAFDRAALAFAEADDTASAARAFERAGDPARAAHLLERTGEHEAAAELYRVAGDLARAGQCYERLERWHLAGELYEQAGEPLPAGECFLRSGFPARAARSFEETGALAHAARAWIAADDLRRAARLFAEADQPLAAADAHFENGDFGEALRLLRGIGPEHTDFYDGMHLMFATLAERGYLTPLDEKTVRTFAERPIDVVSLPAFLDLYRLYLICELGEEAEALAARIRAEAEEGEEVDRALEALAAEHTVSAETPFADFERVLAESFAIGDTGTSEPRRPPRHEPAPAPDGAPDAPAADDTQPTPRGAALADLSPDSVFDGRYRIVRKIGSGGIGAVFLARDLSLDEPVALKVLKPVGEDEDEVLTRFKQEIRITRRIAHPNVVRTYDFGECDHLAYVAMEHVDGKDLKHAIRSAGRIEVARAIEILLDVCDGLAAAHALGIVHRDIKPQNILIDASGRARLIDFGIAKIRDSVASTMSEMLVGTPEYLSPEMALGTAIDHRTDIYSLGIVLYEMLCGEVPFTGSTLMSILTAHLRQDPPPLAERGPDVPETVATIAMRCLAKEASDRYPSVAELRAALADARGAAGEGQG